MNADRVYASDITKALARRHTDDFFMTEVKDGPTQTGRHLRLDAVAIAKSWSHPCISGYEVKVSRSDWMADQKWQFYVPMCHRFTIAAAAGVVHEGEIPDGIGWMEFNPGKGSFRTIKKPFHRDIEINPNMLLYIIMNRLDSDRVPYYKDREAMIRDYLDGKAEFRDVGRRLGINIHSRLEKAEHAVRELEYQEKENAEMITAIGDLRKVLYPHIGHVSVPRLSKEVERLLAGQSSTETEKLVQQIQSSVTRLSELVALTKQNHEQLEG